MSPINPTRQNTSVQASYVDGFTIKKGIIKGPPPKLAPGKLFATYVRSQPNSAHTGSVEDVITLATDGTAATHIFRILKGKAEPGGTIYYYWKMTKGKKPTDGSALVLTGSKHSTEIGAVIFDNDKELGTISPDGKTLKLIEAGDVNVYKRQYPQ